MKISDSLKGNKHLEGYKPSEGTRAKMSASHKALSEETRRKMSIAKKDKKLSTKHRLKMSLTHLQNSLAKLEESA